MSGNVEVRTIAKRLFEMLFDATLQNQRNTFDAVAASRTAWAAAAEFDRRGREEFELEDPAEFERQRAEAIGPVGREEPHSVGKPWASGK